MPPKSSAPMRPDPVTLELIFDKLTSKSADVPATDKAYHLVALGTVAFHATVKKRCAERPDVLKSIAQFLLLRDPCVAECRWETLSLIGELCRREQKDDDAAASSVNNSARIISESFAALPWFRGALRDVGLENEDKDVPIAVKDILEALPNEVVSDSPDGTVSTFEWTKVQREKAHDLMFLDATTTFQHLIPLVARASHLSCVHCGGRGGPTTSAASSSTSNTPLLRCASCKAVYYCSKECQVAHWKVAHKAPCQSMKELTARGASDPSSLPPLEPALFFETRRFLYDHRNESLVNVGYEAFFMQYATGTVVV